MNITLQDLVDAGVHFGHQLKRWNPKTKPYVYKQMNGISIINLEKTYQQIQGACNFVESLVASGSNICFVGTKRQAQEVIRESAVSVEMPFCCNRWMGGTFTNFRTVQKSLGKYKKFMTMETDGSMAKLPKKESAAIRREMNRMKKNFEGIKDISELPDALFVIDIQHEYIAVAEARRMGIPVVALVDTNSDPTLVDYPIIGNDDAVKAVTLITQVITEAVQQGLNQREAKKAHKPLKVFSPQQPGAEQPDVTVSAEANLAIEQPKHKLVPTKALNKFLSDTEEGDTIVEV